MYKKIVGILICLLLLFTIIPIIIDANLSYDPLDGGWLEVRDGVRILHLSGTNYEMGYQYGFLLKDDIPITLTKIIVFFKEKKMSYEDLLEKWEKLNKSIPKCYKDELKGLVDSSNMSYNEIGVLNILHDVTNLIDLNCCGGIAWGDATRNGELIHLRSADFNSTLSENQVLIIRDPVDGYASLSPVLIGDIGSYGGINEKGIAVSENTVRTNDTTLFGLTASFRMRMTLDFADSADDAIYIMNSNRTCGWNLLISDANKPEGYILEQTANISRLCLWNSSCESKKPFWMLKDIVRRSNCFISPECAEFELNRNYYDCSGLKGIFYLLSGLDPHFIPWTHYRVLSQGYEMEWENLNLSNTMDMLRSVYLGKTDVIFCVMMKRFQIYQPIHQWVSSPKSGDMLICFAGEGKLSMENPVHHFNLFELLESEPPI